MHGYSNQSTQFNVENIIKNKHFTASSFRYCFFSYNVNNQLLHVLERPCTRMNMKNKAQMIILSCRVEVHIAKPDKKELNLFKPGSMLPERTTTTGHSLPVTHTSPFEIIRAEVTIILMQRQFKISKVHHANKIIKKIQVAR